MSSVLDGSKRRCTGDPDELLSWVPGNTLLRSSNSGVPSKLWTRLASQLPFVEQCIASFIAVRSRCVQTIEGSFLWISRDSDEFKRKGVLMDLLTRARLLMHSDALYGSWRGRVSWSDLIDDLECVLVSECNKFFGELAELTGMLPIFVVARMFPRFLRVPWQELLLMSTALRVVIDDSVTPAFYTVGRSLPYNAWQIKPAQFAENRSRLLANRDS